MDFHPAEVSLLRELEQELRRVEEWPPESPLAFVTKLASRTKGALGEKILDRVAGYAGVKSSTSRSADFDRTIQKPSGPTRVEVKFSTEDPPRFQQVRDPRRPEGMKYDSLVCISARPFDLQYWMIDADDVAHLIESGEIKRQHQDSDTNWFFPDRGGVDAFTPYRVRFDGVIAWLRS